MNTLVDNSYLKIVSSSQELEERTFRFALKTRSFLKAIPKTLIALEDMKQLLRSSGSIGANYIEANENLGEKDFMMKLKTARREAKESRYWLRLIEVSGDDLIRTRNELIQEAHELLLILSSIIQKRSI